MEMIKVITYGTYDMLHYGHIRLLERAKNLGDYLIVGVTAEDFDKSRGKINVRQSLMERIESVRATGLADEIIVEEYEGQKIDDIKRYGIDIFTVGSDWIGKFDYLNEYCKVVYLERTKGISSTEIRNKEKTIRLGLTGESEILKKVKREAQYVNGLEISGVYTGEKGFRLDNCLVFPSYESLLDSSDAIYFISHPCDHYAQIKQALQKGKHIICESPITMNREQYKELYDLAEENHLVLMDAIKTAYSTAYERLLVLIKSGVIGKVVSVDATCTSLRKLDTSYISSGWGSLTAWGPTALLPVFQLLGTNFRNYKIISRQIDEENRFDDFTKIDFQYDSAVASLKVGIGVKSEGELVVSGENGYVYVPAPWWKTDYFEVRYENAEKNRRYFYQLEGEGIRYMLVVFHKEIQSKRNLPYISKEISCAICEIMQAYLNKYNYTSIQ